MLQLSSTPEIPQALIMRLRSLISCLAFVNFAVCNDVSTSQSNETQKCRCFPGDACWPSTADWHAFNQTVGGKLIKNIPLASVCHRSEYGLYDAKKCNDLKSIWFFPETHLSSVGSIMAPFFANNSCNIFAPEEEPCALGALVPLPLTPLVLPTSRTRYNSFAATTSAL